MTPRSSTMLAWTALAAVGFADLAFFAAQRWVNAGRIARQAPPLLEYSLMQVSALFVAQTAVVVAMWLFLRRRTDPLAHSVRWVAVGLLLFLAARVFVVISGYSAPLDRARLAMTSARVRGAESMVMEYWKTSGHLPLDLSQAGMDADEVFDGWGFRLKYGIDSDGYGFNVKAVGVPDRLRPVPSDDRYELEVARRLEAPSTGRTGAPGGAPPDDGKALKGVSPPS